MNLWDQVLLAVQKHVSNRCFDTWFSPVICRGIVNNTLHLVVPAENFRKCLLEVYAPLLLNVVGNVAQVPPASLKLEIAVETADSHEPLDPGAVNASSHSTAFPATGFKYETPADVEPENCFVSTLNPKYTFDSFVVGSSNDLAHSAAMGVAEKPAKGNNPLYLYGCTGLGKTHLMHAIGNLIKSRNSSFKLGYLSSEEFINDFVAACRHSDKGHMLKFRQKYRSFDILLIDDIQCLIGKTETQNEFFHTFNALYNAQKQVVIASDRAPSQISKLDERLRSRFEWGLTVDIQPPDFETKLAIIKKKTQAELFELNDDVAEYIAGGIRSNVRELEGALNRLNARASLNGIKCSDIDLAYAKGVLRGIVKDCTDEISTNSIISAVATFFTLKPAHITSKNSSKPIVVPRQIAMYLCKELTNQSFPQISRGFGKHHTTVMHSVQKIKELKKSDPAISDALDKISNSLR